MDAVIRLLQEVVQADLEQCQAAIKSGDTAASLEALERAFAKIDTAIDALRSAPSDNG